MSRPLMSGLAVVALGSAVLATPWGAPAGAATATTDAATAATQRVARPTPAAAGERETKAAEARAGRAAEALIARQAPALKVSPGDGFVAQPVISSDGLHYAPYRRTWRGLPVVGGDFVVVTDDAGRVLNTSVAQADPVRLPSATPRLSTAEARDVARAQLTRVRRVSAPELVVWQGDRSHLAWQTSVTGTRQGAPSRRDVYVDARTGALLESEERVADAVGHSDRYGTVTFATTQTGNSYALSHPDAPTLVCQDQTTATTLTKDVDTWGDGDPGSIESGCVDAYYAADQMRQMLAEWLGRDGLDGAGGWVPVQLNPNYYQNASYNGERVWIGRTMQGTWVGTLDIVAHELGHGLDDHTPGGLSAGNTMEFVADVFGAATEAFANNPNDPVDYLIGEKSGLLGDNTPTRVMYDPSTTPNHPPACYSARSIPHAEVHEAAGPGDHWFYLLAEGTNPTNGQHPSPVCGTPRHLTGVGIERALKVMYHAMLMKTSASSYPMYRVWTLAAAKNLESGCALYDTVKAAWDAVAVQAQPGEPTCVVGTSGSGPVTASSPGRKTGTAGTAMWFTLAASGNTAPYTWSATGLPPGLTMAANGTIWGTPTRVGNYRVTATARGTRTGTSGTVSFPFDVLAPPRLPRCVGQQVENSGFEAGPVGPWTGSRGVIDDSATEAAATGSWKAWLNGYGIVNTETLSANVVIPAGCTATLSFSLRVDSREWRERLGSDHLSVMFGNAERARIDWHSASTTFSQYSYGLGPVSTTRTVPVTFTGVEDQYWETSFVIDDVTVTLS